MKLLVTGGCGFIGSALVRLAVARGIEVVNLDRLSLGGDPRNVAMVADSPGYAFEKADIRDRATLDAILARHRPDRVLNLAAETHVDRSIDGPEAFVSTNISGTATLLQAVLQYWHDQGRPADFRFLQVSTDEVYGSLGAEDRFSEASAYAPRSPYAASKAAADHLTAAWGTTYGLPVVITNCSNNYGPYQFPEKLIPVTILNALAGRPIPVYGDGGQVRDWLHVEDHAEALLLCSERAEPGARFVIGAETERSNLDLVRQICDILDRRRPGAAPYAQTIRHVPDRPGHDRRYGIDPSRLRAALGWRARTGIEAGLDRTVAWYLDNEDWWRPLIGGRDAPERQGLAWAR